MNIAVLVLLGLALVLQIIALFMATQIILEEDEEVPGTGMLEARSRPRRFALAFTIGGLILATVGSALSLWAPGFK